MHTLLRTLLLCTTIYRGVPLMLRIRRLVAALVPAVYLAAFLVGPLHAQVCSGGNDGGIDATGNQCGDTATTRVYANDSNMPSSRPTAKMIEIQQSTSATAGTRPTTKMSGAPAASTVSAQGAIWVAKAAPQPSAPTRTSKIETTIASPCSGGHYGGMDATGNQCAEYPVAEMKTAHVAAAKP
jgi:hypothetical protein